MIRHQTTLCDEDGLARTRLQIDLSGRSGAPERWNCHQTPPLTWPKGVVGFARPLRAFTTSDAKPESRYFSNRKPSKSTKNSFGGILDDPWFPAGDHPQFSAEGLS